LDRLTDAEWLPQDLTRTFLSATRVIAGLSEHFGICCPRETLWENDRMPAYLIADETIEDPETFETYSQAHPVWL